MWKYPIAAMSIVLLVSILACTTTQTAYQKSLAGVPEKEHLVLAYSQSDFANKITVRYSLDGLAWYEANFPALLPGSIPIISAQGIAAAGDEQGLLTMVVFDQNSHLRMVWGSSDDPWQQTTLSLVDYPIASSVSACCLGKNRWAFAFRRMDGTISALIYDTAIRQIVTNDIAPDDALNSNAEGRPAICALNNRIVLAWRRMDNGAWRIVTSNGTIQEGEVAFQPPIQQDVPEDDQFQEGVFTDPALGNDRQIFFLAFGRREKGEAGSVGYGLQVEKSGDGSLWGSHSIGHLAELLEGSPLGIAGQSDNTLIVACINSLTGNFAAARYLGERGWVPVQGDAIVLMFGSSNGARKQFALFGVGGK